MLLSNEWNPIFCVRIAICNLRIANDTRHSDIWVRMPNQCANVRSTSNETYQWSPFTGLLLSIRIWCENWCFLSYFDEGITCSICFSTQSCPLLKKPSLVAIVSCQCAWTRRMGRTRERAKYTRAISTYSNALSVPESERQRERARAHWLLVDAALEPNVRTLISNTLSHSSCLLSTYSMCIWFFIHFTLYFFFPSFSFPFYYLYFSQVSSQTRHSRYLCVCSVRSMRIRHRRTVVSLEWIQLHNMLYDCSTQTQKFTAKKSKQIEFICEEFGFERKNKKKNVFRCIRLRCMLLFIECTPTHATHIDNVRCNNNKIVSRMELWPDWMLSMAQQKRINLASSMSIDLKSQSNYFAISFGEFFSLSRSPSRFHLYDMHVLRVSI